MEHFPKKIFKVVYVHDFHNCYKCKLAMESEDQIGTPIRIKVSKKKTVSKEDIRNDFDPMGKLSPEKLIKKNEFQFSVPFSPPTVKPVKKMFLKKKSLSGVHSKSVKTVSKPAKKKTIIKTLPLDCKKKESKSVKNFSKPAKKKTIIEGNTNTNSVKKMSYKLDKKANGTKDKVPGKGTLKRKRWMLNKLNPKNDNYEDDLFENQKFGHFQSLLEDETDSEKYEELKTPVFAFSISPRETTPSPTYRDCYSPTQLSICRKNAEKYHYRINKRRKLCSSEGKVEAAKVDSQSREQDVRKRLEEVARILNVQKIQNEKTSDSEDDQYFSDVLDDSCSVNP